MKALAYLLGARMLDGVRSGDPASPPVPEVMPGPLATTEATAAAWRRWSRAREGLYAATSLRRRPLPARSDPGGAAA